MMESNTTKTSDEKGEPEKKATRYKKHLSWYNFWKVLSIILLIIIVFLLYENNVFIINEKEKINDAMNFINTVLGEQGIAMLMGYEKQDGLYKLDLLINGQQYTSYLTSDGRLLFPSGIDIEEAKSKIKKINERIIEPAVFNITINDDDPVKGNPDAGIVIVEFSDFECPFCKKAGGIINQIFEAYPNSIKLIYKDFPLSFHKNSENAALAAQCSNAQGKFWEYHDLLFENQDALSIENLKDYASQLSLNMSLFNLCLDNKEKLSSIELDKAQAVELGITGTPTFFINGKKLSGNQPFEAFKEIIDKELTNI